MPKLPVVSGKEAIKALSKVGFVISGQKGSHIKLVRERNDSKETIIVPNHKTLKPGTLRNGILKHTSLSVDQFTKLLKK